MKDAIRLGDSTTHGGKVLEAFSQTDLNGKPIAGVGHRSAVLCAKAFFQLPKAAALTPSMERPSRWTA